jgi:hypothetical protein
MRSYYGFDSFFCASGIEGAHEKGGVEGGIGRLRRRHLTPMPHVGSLEALNAADVRDDARHRRTDRNRRRGGVSREAAAAAATGRTVRCRAAAVVPG